MEFERKKVSETKTVVVEREETDREFLRRLIKGWCEMEKEFDHPVNKCGTFSKTNDCHKCTLRLKYISTYPDKRYGNIYDSTDCPLIVMKGIMTHINEHMRRD